MSLWYWQMIEAYRRAYRQAHYLPFLRDTEAQMRAALAESREQQQARYLAELTTPCDVPEPFTRPAYHLPATAIDRAFADHF